MKSLLSPSRASTIGFFSALIAGFVTLCVLGRIVSAQNPFRDFQRFHFYITPEGLYYPTASQVMSLARASVANDQIAVIIGGSSVLYGAGMSPDQLWTRHLQEALDERFKVLNLAFPAGAPTEHGAIAATGLLKAGYKVVYVTNGHPFAAPPFGVSYPYVVWDAYYKGLLLPHAGREAAIAVFSQPGATPADLSELRYRAFLDSWFYFTDLWGTFGHETLFTIWNARMPPGVHFTTPRKDLSDPTSIVAPPPAGAGYSQWDFDYVMRFVRGHVSLACRQISDETWEDELDDAYWISRSAQGESAFPETFRQRTILVSIHESPYYVGALSDRERQCYRRAYSLATSYLSVPGYRVLDVGESWTADDYLDRVHPSEGGGEKLAHEVAPAVRELARALGYLD